MSRLDLARRSLGVVRRRGRPATVAFVAAERRHPDPLLPARRDAAAGPAHGQRVNLLLGLWNGGEMLVLSLYFQQVLKDSPLQTGLAIAPQGSRRASPPGCSAPGWRAGSASAAC